MSKPGHPVRKSAAGPAHVALALWAAGCAEHVLPFFEEVHPDDDRPRKAIDAVRAWARGEDISMGAVRTAAFAAHAAARAAILPAAREAARAAGHAAATAHVAGHARHAAAYAVAAVIASSSAPLAAEKEREWQRTRLPDLLRPLIAATGLS